MAFRIRYTRDVAAPAPVVWTVIADLPAYGEWNPFVVACRSSFAPGTPIRMKVRVLPWFVQPQTETIFECAPGEKLCYGLADGPVKSRRWHYVEAVDAKHSRYVSDFELSGPLAPLVRALLGSRLEKGFLAMTDALVRRAEGIAASDAGERR